MKKETVYDILLDYLDQRRNGALDLEKIQTRLESIGKNDEQVQEIMIVFDDEWDQDCMLERSVKNAHVIFAGGAVVAISLGIVSFLSFLGYVPLVLLWAGGVTAGIMLTIKGWNGIRYKKLHEKRLKNKYQSW